MPFTFYVPATVGGAHTPYAPLASAAWGRTPMVMALGFTAAALMAGAGQARAAEPGADMSGHSHVALFIGAGDESSDGSHWHGADALGLEYEYRLSNAWGVGATLEDLNVENRSNTVAVVTASYHIGRGFRAFAGPGYEFKAGTGKAKPLFRVGLGYEFHIGKRITIAPELINDFVDRNGETWLAGVAFGLAF